jgi:Family of unknown function (DUF695)
MLRRQKKTTVETAEDAWDISRGYFDGLPLSTRFNTAYLLASNRSDYPIQVGVAVPLIAPDAQGMPSNAENLQLQAIEDEVTAESAGRAVLVGVITTKSMREFVLYTKSGDWIEAFHHGLEAAVASHEVQVMAKRDPDWAVYRQFVT